MVDPRSYDGQRVVLVGQRQQRLALDVCVGNIDTIQDWWVVVHDTEEVVVIS